LTTLLLTVAGTILALGSTVTEWTLPPVPAIAVGKALPVPRALAVARDGSVWVSETTSGQLLHIGRDGKVTVGATLANAVPNRIATFPDGSVRFTENAIGDTDAIGPPLPRIGCVGAGGPCAATGLKPPFLGADGIAANANGDFAVIDSRARTIGVIHHGQVHAQTAPRGFVPAAIASAHDGFFWVALQPALDSQLRSARAGMLARLGSDGAVEIHPLPASDVPDELARSGPDIVYLAQREGDAVVGFVRETQGSVHVARTRVPKGVGLLATSETETSGAWLAGARDGSFLHVLPSGHTRVVAPRVLGNARITAIAVSRDYLWYAAAANRLGRIQL